MEHHCEYLYSKVVSTLIYRLKINKLEASYLSYNINGAQDRD